MKNQIAIRNRKIFKRTTTLAVLLIAVALVVPSHQLSAAAMAPATETTVVLQTADAVQLQGNFQDVNSGGGDQTQPHLACNLATYTNDDFRGSSTVHYKDLSTGADMVIPGNQVDLLSDVSGSRIAFTEVTFAGDTVAVYDTVSQTRTAIPGLNKSGPSIGGNLVAFQYYPDSNGWHTSEIATYDLATQTLTQLTNDGLANYWVDVSPTGDTVVWEKCQTYGVGCDIYSARQTSPGVFTTTALTQGGGDDRVPSTNGELAVYTSNRSGENDIYYQSVTGGSEVHLSIPGEQRNPSISGHLISFESQDQNGYDIFVYDVSSGKLFRVTDTPGRDETINDISVCNGVGKIIYVFPGDGSFDLYGFTFNVPTTTTTTTQVEDLISLVQSFGLPHGITNSLIAKLQDALTAFGSYDTATACSSLTAFTNECRAQSGKKLTADQASQLITSANQIKTNLGCP